jgi:hypothetical protein
MALTAKDLADIERIVKRYRTAEQAAKAIGISPATLSRYRSKTLAPTERTIGWLRENIAEALEEVRGQ